MRGDRSSYQVDIMNGEEMIGLPVRFYRHIGPGEKYKGPFPGIIANLCEPWDPVGRMARVDILYDSWRRAMGTDR